MTPSITSGVPSVVIPKNIEIKHVGTSTWKKVAMYSIVITVRRPWCSSISWGRLLRICMINTSWKDFLARRRTTPPHSLLQRSKKYPRMRLSHLWKKCRSWHPIAQRSDTSCLVRFQHLSMLSYTGAPSSRNGPTPFFLVSLIFRRVQMKVVSSFLFSIKIMWCLVSREDRLTKDHNFVISQSWWTRVCRSCITCIVSTWMCGTMW